MLIDIFVYQSGVYARVCVRLCVCVYLCIIFLNYLQISILMERAQSNKMHQDLDYLISLSCANVCFLSWM